MITELDIFARRLKQARILKKISMDKLVVLMNSIVTKQAISKYESAIMMPNDSVLTALATALDVNQEYFFRPFSFDIDDFQVSFRKKSGTSAKDINALKVQIQDEIERYLEIEEILGKNKTRIEQVEGSTISSISEMRDLAIKIRNDWNLGIDAIANVQDTLEGRGIKLIHITAPEGFDGVSGIVNDDDFIVVLNNKKDHVERKRFTAMHELGHLLCNKRFSKDLTPREREKLCDTFASEMLLPAKVVNMRFKPGEKISLPELRQIQVVYGISIDAIMHKLKDLCIISEAKYRGYNIRKRQNTNLKKYVEESCYKEQLTNKFQTMVYEAAAKELITTTKAAALLHTTTSNINKNLNII